MHTLQHCIRFYKIILSFVQCFLYVFARKRYVYLNSDMKTHKRWLHSHSCLHFTNTKTLHPVQYSPYFYAERKKPSLKTAKPSLFFFFPGKKKPLFMACTWFATFLSHKIKELLQMRWKWKASNILPKASLP